MKVGGILYGDLGDIVAMSALSNFIRNIQKDISLTLITSTVYENFTKIYGSFSKIIGFSTNDINKVVREVNNTNLDIICDLHSSSYSDPDHIYWLSLIKTGKIRVTKDRMNKINKHPLSYIEELNNRIISVNEHNVENYLKRFGIKTQLNKDSLKITPTVEDKKYKEECFKNKLVVGFVPNSRFPHKEWNYKNWSKLAHKLKSIGNYAIVILCAEYEVNKVKPLADITSSDILSSETPEGHVKNVLTTDILVSLDTGLKHIAGYLNHPVISLYGHSSPEIWGTLSSSEYIIRGNLECIPCNNPFFCKFENSTCVDSIPVEKVLEKIILISEK